jgi:uncharacterized protein YuzE
MRAVARAFHHAIVGIEIEQHSKVTLAAGIHPIDNKSHLIEIAHASNPVCRGKIQRRLRITLVNMR